MAAIGAAQTNGPSTAVVVGALTAAGLVAMTVKRLFFSAAKAKVRHVVMGRFTSAATAKQKDDMIVAVLAMKASIPEIVEIECGLDLGLADGNHSFAAHVDFASEEAYLVYAKHPVHVGVITSYIKPILEPGTRTAVQFAL